MFQDDAGVKSQSTHGVIYVSAITLGHQNKRGQAATQRHSENSL